MSTDDPAGAGSKQVVPASAAAQPPAQSDEDKAVEKRKRIELIEGLESLANTSVLQNFPKNCKF